MRNPTPNLVALIGASLIAFFAAATASRGEGPATKPSAPRTEVQAKSEIEQQRSSAEQQATKTLDKDAIEASKETMAALKAAEGGKTDDAIAAIERATGKINILIARNPANALIPIDVQVEVVDAAPLEAKAIKTLAAATEDAVKSKDYPAARTLLQGLRSEIRVRTVDLPLASYPTAMQEAARLLDQKKDAEAAAVLHTALNTLVVVDHVTPLPLVLAQAIIGQAQVAREKSDRQRALALLAQARFELDRARDLGYAGMDPEYNSLADAVSDLEKQVEGNENTESAFAKLKEKISSFFHRHAANEKKSEVASK